MKLKDLHTLTSFFAGFTTTEQLVSSFPEAIRRLVKADADLLYFPVHERLNLKHQQGFATDDAELINSIFYSYGKDTFRLRQPILVDDFCVDTVNGEHITGVLNIKSGAFLPLLFHEEVVGVMGAFSSRTHFFTPEAVELLVFFAHLFALHLHRMTFKEAQRSELAAEFVPPPRTTFVFPEPRNFVEQIIDTDPNLIFVKDQRGNFIFANQAVADLFNMSKEEVINRNNAELHRHEHEINHYSSVERQVVREMKQIIVEEAYTDRNGKTHWYQSIKKPLVTDDGNVYILGIATEITDRKAFEEELIRARQVAEASVTAKDDFLSVMSHEIRTPLNTIIGMTHLLMQENPKPEQVEFLKTLSISANNLLVLLNDVLDLSKIQAGKIDFEYVDFNLRDVIRSIKQSFKLRAEDKNINFKITVEESVPEYIRGDALRLNQVLTNLISNAIKFTQRGSVKLEVNVKQQQGDEVMLEFEVIDTGIGIPRDKRDIIFERFTQATSDIARKYGGTGLGLSITKNLVELQGGAIEVESEENAGSVFRVLLPFKKTVPPPRLQSTGLPYQELASLKGLYVLLAEDVPTNQMLTVRFLNNWGIETDVAENGREAVEKVHRRSYDLVLMDLQMPEMDGYQATREIRSFLGSDQRLPIIALTADTSERTRQQILEAGMNDLLPKPINPAMLHEKIRQYAGSPVVPQDAEEEDEFFIDIPSDTETMASTVADYSFLREAAAGNQQFMKMMLQLTLREFSDFGRVFIEAVRNGQFEEVSRLRHKINPHIESYKLDEINYYLEKIQRLMESGEPSDKLELQISHLKPALDAVQEEFRRIIEKE